VEDKGKKTKKNFNNVAWDDVVVDLTVGPNAIRYSVFKCLYISLFMTSFCNRP
jgi:hypothetical protein